MKLLMISLGCDKNLTNTEEMMGLLERNGYSFTDDAEDAEIIIINTCCFIGDAKEESVNTILEMAEYKHTNGGNCKVLAVCGCLAQRYSSEIRTEIPEVDIVIGTSAYEDIIKAIDAALNGDGGDGLYIKDINYLPDISDGSLITTGGHYAYLKIAEGCSKHCTYCIIPSLRGTYRSVPFESIINKAKALARDGVKELILVAQETTLYGVDLYGQNKLPALLRALDEIDGIEWIRLLYAYPEDITDELIDAMAALKKVCHYIDMPIQSGADAVLKRMGRLTTTDTIRNTVNKLREKMPDICIRTTFITGFPGETEDDHADTMRFADEMEFDRVGVFTYSCEEDTPAAKLPEQIDEEIKEFRRSEIMALQQDIVFEKNEALAGTVTKAFVEGLVTEDAFNDDEYADARDNGGDGVFSSDCDVNDESIKPSDFDGNIYVARTFRDAPGVDGLIFIETYDELMSGSLIDVKITGASGYDLIGEVVQHEFT